MGRFSLVSLLVLGGLLASALSDARPTAPVRLRSAVAEADTVRFRHRAGAPFLFVLPRQERGRNVSYTPLQLPALSWYLDYALYYNPLPQQRGGADLSFLRSFQNGPTDTLVVHVDLYGE